MRYIFFSVQVTFIDKSVIKVVYYFYLLLKILNIFVNKDVFYQIIITKYYIIAIIIVYLLFKLGYLSSQIKKQKNES